MAEPTQLSPAPLQSPVFDRTGRMTAEWQRYFMQLFAVSANVATSLVTITESVTDLADSAALDTRNARDVGAIAEEAAAQVPAASPRDFTPLIEEALLLSPAPSVKDYTPDIEAAVRSVLQDARTPRVVPADLDDIYSRLACLESPNRGSASNAAVTDFDAAGAAEEIGRQQAQPLFKDYGPDIEAAVRGLLLDAQTPRVTPADLDEMQRLIATLGGPSPIPANWAAWTPTLSASGAMTVSAVVVTSAIYILIGSLVFIQIQANFTLAGTADFFVFFTLPLPCVSPNGGNVFFTAYQVNPSPNWGAGFSFCSGSPNLSTAGVQKIPQVTWTLGASNSIGVTGFYRTQ